MSIIFLINPGRDLLPQAKAPPCRKLPPPTSEQDVTKLLLLDEHTAALDPKTALQIMELTQQLVEEQKLTTLMVTHNMQQAIAFGNRLLMLHQDEVILDLEGEEKQGLTVDDLLDRFHALRGEDLASDRLLLG